MGLEGMLDEWTRTWKGRKSNNVKTLSLVVYADDFVVLHESKEIIEEAKVKITKWCKNHMGVELSDEKTKITHTSSGFDFLGFNVRQYKVTTNKQGFKTLIKPSKIKVAAHKEVIRKAFTRMKSAPQEALIAKLNPIIRGWANNYSHVVSKEIFASLDNDVWEKLWRWSTRRHPNKAKQWVMDKYFPRKQSRKWIFQTNKGAKITTHSEVKIVRHVKVRGTKHVYDGDTTYWLKRGYKDPTVSLKVRNLFKKQKGICTWCKDGFTHDDVMEVDHIKPKNEGGKDIYENLQLLHRHCHDTKTAQDTKRQNKQLMTFADWDMPS
ncbi:MAG: hypothetical protein DRR16_28710 [Candidatus Parabeggiatoa sp. nov. 3]|nr:MAG: hypothetical protein DRR16_28710 [Gammaproteobacteria bacterium]